MKIFLVSDCPMRKRPLDPIGLPYEMRPSRIDEKAIRDESPAPPNSESSRRRT